VITYGFNKSCDEPPHLWGGYAQFMYLHPRAIVHKISDSLPATLGVLIGAVIADEIRWVRTKGGVTLGDYVVIEGAGAQGLVAVAIAKEAGASLIIVTGLSRDESRIELAREFGANHFINIEKENPVNKVEEITGGRMADVVIDVTGSAEVPPVSIDLVRPLGTIVAASTPGFKQKTSIITDKIALKEISYLGVFTSDATSMAQGIALTESRKYPFEKLVTHMYPLEDAEKAISAAKGDVPDEYPLRAAIVPW
jgi:alcohol dehydrogenase